ncbi:MULTISPECIES: ubiquinol-cytochrome C chaperone family protein [unclassified Beijerinckia]|uniref:ubiquinol-cytochrome C chaperone family protein n=1 Tax=unclassified Beijerinckia TaxID=2638183 RepID=UPI000895D234|nr:MULTISPECIES: ubiquinol-cytochrome C chaperone family protein [unclassified Beijerinckia]MDH7794725.1 cytochrome b pre-mRNA-processing protein 3 [Beijerinckia sp. GAS462]SEB72752.1 cytochrome b pre-mRNA-processing protein 3 [Beijerinckia sp. 28-YEA-48]
MAFSFFRRSRNRPVIERLQGEIMAASRQPAFFLDYQVTDTVSGRFELLSLHTGLLVWRVETLPAPGPDLAQDLTDAVFHNIDTALREIGIGDVSMPKKMKSLAQGYLGRTLAYRTALEAGDLGALAQALARNVYGDEGRAGDPACQRLARYTQSLNAAYSRLDLESAWSSPLPVVDAATIV